MSKFCKKCGTELRDDADFCLQCGAAQKSSMMDQVNHNSASKVSQRNSGAKQKKILIAVLVILVIIAGGAFMAFHGKNDKKQEASNVIAQVATEKESNTSTNKISSPTNSAATQAQSELKQRGIQGTVVASSKGHSNSGYVSLVNNNGQYQIVTYDIKNGRVGTTPYDRSLLYFTDKKPTGSGTETIIFNITVLNDAHDNDKNAGVWEGNNHIIPVYAAYKFDGNGNLVPGMLTTGKGVKPSHYQEYFYETRNVDTINLLLTEMISLQKNIADNKVALP